MEEIQLRPDSAEFIWGPVAALLLLMIVTAAVLVSRDMSGRGRTGWVYGLLVLVIPPLGLLVWAVVRACDRSRTARRSSVTASPISASG